ncbi:hypothetical protein NA78x_001893 [Anatilimnocola sp. NA78]|uniref:hypothetical protein n=1 Tax=Anatilimnocola sp. NA78 TaxID=3415683 RepID=UPI003CE4F3EC
MPDGFDPYYKWLAIPPTEQPPNHYRLLGVPLYTADLDVIENAADQRMAHLRSFQAGKYSQESQRLLNEVATARVCLLNGAKKSTYDEMLRNELQPVAAPTAPPSVAIAAPAALSRPVIAQPQLRPIPLPPPLPPPLAVTPTSPTPSFHAAVKRKPAKSPLAEIAKHVVASAGGLLCGYLLISFWMPSWDHFGLFHRQAVSGTQLPDRRVILQPIEPPEEVVSASPSGHAPIRQAPPRQERPAEPQVQPKPAASVVPPLSAEELAQRAEEERQQRLTKLQADREAAIAAGKVTEALHLTTELAELSKLDPQSEQTRVIEELRKIDLTPTESLALASALLEQAQHSFKNNRKDVAIEQATAALQLARKTTNQDLVREATKLILEIQRQE